jgi:hypothetical protein
MLAVDGARVMEISGEKPGPRIGWVLHALLEQVLEDPTKNTPEYMETEAQSLLKLPDGELRALGEKGKERQSEEEEREITSLRKKYHVR